MIFFSLLFNILKVNFYASKKLENNQQQHGKKWDAFKSLTFPSMHFKLFIFSAVYESFIHYTSTQFLSKNCCLCFLCAAPRIENFFHTPTPRAREKKRDDEKGMKLDCNTEEEFFAFFKCWLNFTFWKVNLRQNPERLLKIEMLGEHLHIREFMLNYTALINKVSKRSKTVLNFSTSLAWL